MTTEIKLPELGENIEEAEVLSVLVSPGDTVEKDQPLIELETDKATAEVPSEGAGVVKEVLVKPGDEVRVGQTIVTLESAGDGAGAKTKAKPAAEEDEAGEKPAPRAKKPEKADAAPGKTTREPEPGEAPEPEATPEPASGPEATGAAEEPSPPLRLVDTPSPAGPPEIGDVAPAAPSVRRLARELGIDIARVQPSGSGGRISEEDVKQFARSLITRIESRPAAAPSGGGGIPVPELPDFSRWGAVEREPASKVRRVTAEAMSLSWNVIPHVTQFDRADITELEEWRKRYGSRAEAAGAKLTVTAVAVRVVASALKVFPKFNASYDARSEEIVYKKYVSVGVAVDTDHGLLVPVIRDADRKNILEIASELGTLAEKARSRKITADELQGANLNVSNLGGLGTTYFSPIVAWPQVAVVGIGRANREAVYEDGKFQPRLILPLAVSYDHRVIDGADAARFLRWVAEALEEPLLLALEG